MVKHTQTIRQQIADKFFESVRPFCGVGAERVKYDSHCNYIKNNMVIKLSYYLQIQRVYRTKVKPLMCTKRFTKIKTSLISAVIQRIENSMMNPIK